MWLTDINIETSYISRTIDTQIRQVKIQLCSGPKIPVYFRIPALKRCIQKLQASEEMARCRGAILSSPWVFSVSGIDIL